METTFKKVVEGEIMESLFEASHKDFSIKYFVNKTMEKDETLEFNPKTKYKYEIRLRHYSEGTDAKELFNQAITNYKKPLQKTAQQRQFEQTTDKLRSLLAEMEETLKLMPRKGNNTATCQRTNIGNYLGGIDSCINGIELNDFTPNEYSGDFKLSYS